MVGIHVFQNLTVINDLKNAVMSGEPELIFFFQKLKSVQVIFYFGLLAIDSLNYKESESLSRFKIHEKLRM